MSSRTSLTPETFLRAGQRVFVGGSSNEPAGLLARLQAVELPTDLHFLQFPNPAYNSTDFTALNPTTQLSTFFMTPALKQAPVERLHYLPMHMRRVFDYLRTDVDVALIQVARDRHGDLRLGPNADFVDAVLGCAGTVIAELNHGFVAPAGAPRIQAERIDCLFETERGLSFVEPPEIDEVATEIGRQVAALIDDGDCLQTGIGAIPAAILAALSDKNDLGLHGGLLDDGGMALVRAGNVTGAMKEVDRGQHITGMALGSAALMDWLADEPSVVLRGADHTHESGVIGKLSRFVSINSAVEVDLFGQVNGEFAGGRQLSGTGGAVDFMRAAQASSGGKSIVAMTATARGGTVSRIVPRVELATAARTDGDMVVTEFGVARLRGRSVAEREAALIAIAAPQFRDELRLA